MPLNRGKTKDNKEGFFPLSYVTIEEIAEDHNGMYFLNLSQ